MKKIEEKWREELKEEGIVGDEKDEWSEGIEDEKSEASGTSEWNEGRVKKDDEWEGRIEEENKESRESREEIEEESGERIKGGKGKVHTDIYMNLNSEAYHNLDYIILDEFHRCGAREWSKQITLLLSNNPQANAHVR